MLQQHKKLKKFANDVHCFVDVDHSGAVQLHAESWHMCHCTIDPTFDKEVLIEP